MTGRHHWCNGHKLGQTPGDGEGQGGLACCSPWGYRESDVTWPWLGNWATMNCCSILSKGFPGSSAGKESICNAGDLGSIPGLEKSPGEGIGYSLQYSWASLVAQLVKNPLAMRKTWVGKIPWRMEQLPTPVFWPGEFHGLYNPWGHKESDITDRLSLPILL